MRKSISVLADSMVLGVLDHEDLAAGPSRVRAVPQNAARVVIVPVVDDPGQDVAARAGR